MSDLTAQDARPAPDNNNAAPATLSEQGGDLLALMNQTPVGIVVVDMAGNVEDVNQAAIRILGAPNREAMLSINVLTQKRLIERGVSAMYQYVIETGELFEIEMPYESRWGRKVHLRTSLSPRRDAQGRQTGVIQILEDVTQQRWAETNLERQLRYEQALAQTARDLLRTPQHPAEQRTILNQTLDHLVIAAKVDRAYIFHFFDDPELGECLGVLAEACAPGILHHLDRPHNRRVPVADVLPQVLMDSLKQGQPIGGAVAELWQSMPDLRQQLLSQPLLAVQWFPIFIEDELWGFVGFDDVRQVRQWHDTELMLLQTAADIFGSALQRWQTDRALQRERDILEQRVQERTARLERRLQIERVLATTAARLMTREDFGTAITQSLQDVGEMLDATRVLLTRIDIENRRIFAAYEWLAPDIHHAPMSSGGPADWFRHHLLSHKPLYITDPENQLDVNEDVKRVLRERGVRAMIMYPLVVDDQVVGVFNISLRGPLTGEDAEDVIAMLDVAANLLNGLLQRQILIEHRDRQILEQTRALSAMLEAAMLDTDARELNDIIHPILLLIAELSRASALAVYRRQPDNRFELVADFNSGQDRRVWQAAFQPAPRMARWYAEQSDPLLLNPDQLTGMLPIAGEARPAGVGMLVNIRAWQHFDGLLFCYRPGSEQYSPHQVAITTALADYMSTIIENYLLREVAENTAIIEERQRLARDLHDSVSQSLYGVMLFARAGRDALEADQYDALSVDLARVEENALRAMKEMRLLLFQLQPLSFERGGLEQALAHRFEQVEGRLGIETEVMVEPGLELPPDVAEPLYRLASEALNNALKHADATRVSVHLARDGDAILLTVTDNGRGFDPAQVSQAGMGLTNMRYRAENAGGELFIDSAPGQGAVIRCRIPLHRL